MQDFSHAGPIPQRGDYPAQDNERLQPMTRFPLDRSLLWPYSGQVMDGRVHGAPGIPWAPPTISDYGTLTELSADGGAMMHVGVTSFAQVTNPLNPNSGGGGGTAGTTGGGVEAPGTEGVGGTAGEGAGDVAPAGAGGAGGGGEGGGDGGSLPFTGFPAAVLAGIGAGLAVGGKKLRSIVGRNADEPQPPHEY